MRRRLKDERGAAVTVWAVLVTTALTLIMGLAVDLSGQVTALRMASDVAAQAARAAGQQLDADTYSSTGGEVEVAAARAKAAAINYAQAAGMTATARIESGTDLIVEVTAGYEPGFLSAFGTRQVHATARVRVVKALEGKER
jgi:Flp pilus assembly protein TadG